MSVCLRFNFSEDTSNLDYDGMRHNLEEFTFYLSFNFIAFITNESFLHNCVHNNYIKDLGAQLSNPRRISQHCQGGKFPKETNGSCSLHVTD